MSETIIKEIPLTVENGKLNRRWFNNRVIKKTINVYEKNMNDDKPIWEKLENPNKLLSMLTIYSDGNRIVGYLGTSFYYQFTI